MRKRKLVQVSFLLFETSTIYIVSNIIWKEGGAALPSGGDI